MAWKRKHTSSLHQRGTPQGRLDRRSHQSHLWQTVTTACLTGRFQAHLCVASSIRAMPENANPPAGGFLLLNFLSEIIFSSRAEAILYKLK
ncbi:MAG: hypothetical protein IJ039_08810, partial [Clostridia bacterium]|nr:hypothetical protein [Clostridia bacterium]